MHANFSGSHQCLAIIIGASRHVTEVKSTTPFDGWMLFGFLACMVNVLCLIECRPTWKFLVSFSLSCAAVAGYAIEAGAWPLAMIEAAMAFTAARYCRPRGNSLRPARRSFVESDASPAVGSSRSERLFGEPPSTWN